ncbi:glycosyltransferase family 2 protein [Ralstonia pickettii]|uniref:glycosyltransferase family 2 protein n=1 Tax=Ralstonia pickettii TaxID=329 RepID=UPI0027155A46|nr:glycosyltransferase family 2 protein [Ralstonia pickettii]WKZ85939.1 glycosyltransferase family 2 protein [Ralstonia pickettii]
MAPVDNIWAVVVCYRPALEQLSGLLEAVTPQVTGIIVVDNDPGKGLREWMDGRSTGHCVYLPMDGNVGVATGHNMGIAAARDRQATHVVLFDQDSLPAPTMIARLRDAMSAAEGHGLKAASAGPFFHDPRDGSYYPFIRLSGWKIERVRQPDTESWCSADYLITSGCLISMAALDEIGGMEDGLFIDYIDIEWGLRARSKGFVNLGVFDAAMEHDLGEPPRRYLRGRLRVPMHSPLRHYYLFRNALRLYRRSYIPWRWRLNDGYRLLLKGVFYSLCVENRSEQRRMILRGCAHGMADVCGQYGGERS